LTDGWNDDLLTDLIKRVNELSKTMVGEEKNKADDLIKRGAELCAKRDLTLKQLMAKSILWDKFNKLSQYLANVLATLEKEAEQVQRESVTKLQSVEEATAEKSKKSKKGKKKEEQTASNTDDKIKVT
jgi:hypothetical protein